MRSFSVSARTTKQDLNERNHLCTRAYNGLTSDRYRKADYAAFEEFTRKENAKAKNTEIKVKTMKGKINLRNENNFIQKQNQVWSESFENLGKELIKAEEGLHYGKESFLKVSEMLSEEDFDDFSRMWEQIDESMQSYDDNIVEPLRCLKADLNYKVYEEIPTEEDDVKEINKVVEDVKYQAFHVLRQLEEESGKLQQEVDAYNSNQQISKEMFDPPPMDEMFSLEVLGMIEEFDVGQLFFTQLRQLYKKYGDYFDETSRKIEEIQTQLEVSLWSCKELLMLTTVIDLYRRYTPEYLSKKNSNLLQLEMLDRLLPKKSKLEIIEAESLVIRKRYFSKRLNGLYEDLCVEVSSFRNRAMNILYEKSERYLADNATEYTRQQQQQICQQLHHELQELRDKKAEIERLEEVIASKEREKLEEEKRKENEKENKRRNKAHSDIVEYRRKKSAEREHERAKMEAKLQQLKAELQEQEKIDRERVKYREEKYFEKLQMQADKRHMLELEEIEKEERLDALRKTVAVTAEADPARMVQNTICYEAKMGIGVNQDLDLQAPLFKFHGFSDQKIKSDPRLRVERELRKMHLHGTDYARSILSRIAPPTKPRPDSFSTGYQSTLNKDS